MQSVKYLIRNYKTDINNMLLFCNNKYNIAYFLTKENFYQKNKFSKNKFKKYFNKKLQKLNIKQYDKNKIFEKVIYDVQNSIGICNVFYFKISENKNIKLIFVICNYYTTTFNTLHTVFHELCHLLQNTIYEKLDKKDLQIYELQANLFAYIYLYIKNNYEIGKILEYSSNIINKNDVIYSTINAISKLYSFKDLKEKFYYNNNFNIQKLYDFIRTQTGNYFIK